MSPQEDDFSHYFNAVGRLQSENADLRVALQATIAQQRAHIDELKLALDKADPLDPSFLRYLELEQQLQTERERAEKAEAIAKVKDIDLARWKLYFTQANEQLQTERERAEDWEAASKETGQSNWTKAQWRQLAHLAKHARDEFEQQLQAEREKSAGLERQLERHAGLLHMAVHNWALHSRADCPEVECQEYRALFSPTQ